MGLPSVRPRDWHHDALQHLRLGPVRAAGHGGEEKETGLGGAGLVCPLPWHEGTGDAAPPAMPAKTPVLGECRGAGTLSPSHGSLSRGGSGREEDEAFSCICMANLCFPWLGRVEPGR